MSTLYVLGCVLVMAGCVVITQSALDQKVSVGGGLSSARQRSAVMLAGLSAVAVCAAVSVVGLDLTEDRLVAAMGVGVLVALMRGLAGPQTSGADDLEQPFLVRVVRSAFRSAARTTLLWLKSGLIVVLSAQVWVMSVLPLAAWVRPWWYDDSDTLRLLGALPTGTPVLILVLVAVSIIGRRVRGAVSRRWGLG